MASCQGVALTLGWLFLCFFEGDAFADRWVEFDEFDLTLYAFAVFAGPINIVGLGRLEFYEVILRHLKTLQAFESLSKNSHFGLTSTRSSLFDLKGRFPILK